MLRVVRQRTARSAASPCRAREGHPRLPGVEERSGRNGMSVANVAEARVAYCLYQQVCSSQQGASDAPLPLPMLRSHSHCGELTRRLPLPALDAELSRMQCSRARLLVLRTPARCALRSPGTAVR